MVKKNIAVGVKMFGKDDILIVCALEKETAGELVDWNILYTGVGKVNATYKLTHRLTDSTHGEPKIVINYGTAGSRDLPIGELVDCTKFVQRDMNVSGLGFMEGQTPFENDVPIILDSTDIKFNPIGKNYVCGTGDNFVENIEDISGYIDVLDMEAYALAKVCRYLHIPFISFKYITDNANEHASGDWEDNCSNGIHEFKGRILGCV